MHELEDPSIERRIHFGLQLMAFTRSLVKDEKAAVKIVERSFEKLYDAERKFTFVNDETVSTYLRLSAKTLADYYLKQVHECNKSIGKIAGNRSGVLR